MKSIFTATEARNKFGQICELAQKRIVKIEKHDKPIAYVISPQTYNDFVELHIKMKQIIKASKNSY